MPKNLEELSFLFQYECCGVHYAQYPKKYPVDNKVSDTIIVYANTMSSSYRAIKIDEIVELHFVSEAYLADKDCEPEAFGEFIKVDKKLVGVVYVAPAFSQRLSLLLSQGIRPYFDLSCDREPYQKPVIRIFRMLSEIDA